MRTGALALAFLLSAVPSRAEMWTGPAESLSGGIGGSYRSVASISFVSYGDLGDKEFVGSYRHYLPYSIIDNDQPYRLQPFLQHASYLEGSFTDGMGDSTLFAVGGMYYLPAVRLSVGGSFGFGASPDGGDQRALGAEATYYFTDAHDLALEIQLSDGMTEKERVGGPPPRPLEEKSISMFAVGARYVVSLPNTPAILDVAAGYRNTEEEDVGVDEGAVIEARYFFNKQLFAGLGFSTEEARRFEVSGGYTAPENFQVEAALGTDDVDGDYFRIEVGLRF